MYVHGTQYWAIALSYPFVLAATAHCYLPVFYRSGEAVSLTLTVSQASGQLCPSLPGEKASFTTSSHLTKHFQV